MTGLTFKDKLIYGFGSLGDACGYTFIGTFLIFFLTTVAGVNPIMAGTITAIGSIANTFSSPVMGFLSDNIMTKNGRRIPFLRMAAIPYGLACFMTFTAVPLTGALQTIYYIFSVMLFWVSYSAFFNAYTALGAEVTPDYDERTSLRAVAYIISTFGMFAGMVLPNSTVALLEKMGLSYEAAWSISAAAIGIICAVSVLLTGASERKGTIIPEDIGKKIPSIKVMLLEYAEIFKLRPLWFLVAASAMFLISNSIGNATRIYFFTYNLELSAWQISLLMIIVPVGGMVFTPLCKAIATAHDKRVALNTCLLIAGGGLVCIWFAMRLGASAGVLIGILFCTLYSVSNTAYWQLMPGLFYDICALDELTFGKPREGAISAIQCFAEAASSAIGLQLMGIILGIAGFDGEQAVQSAKALSAIQGTLLLLVPLFMAFAFVLVKLYPITKEKYKEIQEQLQARK